MHTDHYAAVMVKTDILMITGFQFGDRNELLHFQLFDSVRGQHTQQEALAAKVERKFKKRGWRRRGDKKEHLKYILQSIQSKLERYNGTAVTVSKYR